MTLMHIPVTQEPHRLHLGRALEPARQAGRGLMLWFERWQQRRQLMALNDRELRDIGLTHGDVVREGLKPFWRA